MTPSGITPKDISRTAITRPRTSGSTLAWITVLFVVMKSMLPVLATASRTSATKKLPACAKAMRKRAMRMPPVSMIIPLRGAASRLAAMSAPTSPPTPVLPARMPSAVELAKGSPA